jgi:hypothetical protein
VFSSTRVGVEVSGVDASDGECFLHIFFGVAEVRVCLMHPHYTTYSTLVTVVGRLVPLASDLKIERNKKKAEREKKGAHRENSLL